MSLPINVLKNIFEYVAPKENCFTSKDDDSIAYNQIKTLGSLNRAWRIAVYSIPLYGQLLFLHTPHFQYKLSFSDPKRKFTTIKCDDHNYHHQGICRLDIEPQQDDLTISISQKIFECFMLSKLYAFDMIHICFVHIASWLPPLVHKLSKIHFDYPQRKIYFHTLAIDNCGSITSNHQERSHHSNDINHNWNHVYYYEGMKEDLITVYNILKLMAADQQAFDMIEPPHCIVCKSIDLNPKQQQLQQQYKSHAIDNNNHHNNIMDTCRNYLNICFCYNKDQHLEFNEKEKGDETITSNNTVIDGCSGYICSACRLADGESIDKWPDSRRNHHHHHHNQYQENGIIIDEGFDELIDDLDDDGFADY